MAASKRQSMPARANGRVPVQAYDDARRAQLVELQRARILGAMYEVVCERGVANVTVAHVVERSGVSRRTFYELFNDREECFLAAFEQALTYATQRVVPAYDVEGGWRERVRAGLMALLAFIDEQPRLGQVLIKESLSGGHRALKRRAQVVEALTRAVDEGRGESKGAASEAPLAGEGVVGGVLSVIQTRLAGPGNKPEPLVDLANPLMSMIVLPYLGAAAARRELARPVVVPKNTDQAGPLVSDPFKETGMRITYRTVQVLIAIAEHPDGSNRLIGQTAGIGDQGQISKLLSRLQRIGLVENTFVQPGKGAPNSWALTEKGRRIVDGVRAHTNESLR